MKSAILDFSLTSLPFRTIYDRQRSETLRKLDARWDRTSCENLDALPKNESPNYRLLKRDAFGQNKLASNLYKGNFESLDSQQTKPM